MGTFAKYDGVMDIPEEQREDFSNKILKILNYGGMMKFEVVNMFGIELGLTKELELDEYGCARFHYNYFEDDAWETAEYNSNTGKFYTEKIGEKEFCNAVLAAYMLYELWDEDSPGMVFLDCTVVGRMTYAAWINHLCHTKYTLRGRVDRFFENFSTAVIGSYYYKNAISNDKRYDICPSIKAPALNLMDIADLKLIYFGTETLPSICNNPDHDDADIGYYKYLDDILACQKAILKYLEDDAEEKKQHIWELLKKNLKERMNYQKSDLSEIAKFTTYLPARVFVYLVAEYMKEDFWKEWESIGTSVYKDEIRKQYESDEEIKHRESVKNDPIDPISTADFLSYHGRNYITDADRLYWWDGSDEVIISEELDQWLQELRKRYQEILKNTSQTIEKPDKLLKKFMSLLYDINNRYHRIFAFQEMFYEFVNHSDRQEYQAAVELLRILADENMELQIEAENAASEEVERYWYALSDIHIHNTGRLRIKRYLSFLANRKLRKKYLGF